MHRRRAKSRWSPNFRGGGHAGCIRRQLGAGFALIGRKLEIAARSESSIPGFGRGTDRVGGRAGGGAVAGAAGRRGRLSLCTLRPALSRRRLLAIAFAELGFLARRG